MYVSAMSLGPATIAAIARAAGLKRTTVYSIFQALRQRGLMREEIKGWKKLYVAERPEKLEAIIDQLRNEVRKNMPEFTAMYNLHASGAFIKYYEGLENIKGVYSDLLDEIKAHDDYLIIGDLDRWIEQDREFFSDFAKKRSKLNIRVRMLLQHSPLTEKYREKDKILNAEIKLLPPAIKLTTNLVIIPHKAVINQLTPPIMAVVIENENIINMNRNMFEAIWKSAD